MTSRLRQLSPAVLGLALLLSACSDDNTTNPLPGPTVATLSGNVTADRTLYADTVYTLSGYVKVQNGATLTIQAGTKIIGDTTVAGSSLWILRGATLIANGSASSPIVLTSARAVGNRKPGDWGGLIIIGNGIVSRTGVIETEGGAAGQSEVYSGGTDNDDSSGSLRYVRVEFAGYDISGGGGQELNSFSSYAVGRGTTYEYLESLAGLDDSFEFWGGAVDSRYLISYEAGDDHFDASEGHLGRHQFLIGLQRNRLDPQTGSGGQASDPRGFEMDGCAPGESGCIISETAASEPYTNPTFANFTLIGPGDLATFPADGNGAVIRRGSGGLWVNGVIAGWKGTAIDVRDAWCDTLLSQRDSLNFWSVILAQNGANYDAIGTNFGQQSKFAADNHQAFGSTVLIDTLIGINLTPGSLDWTPKTNSPVDTGTAATVPAARVTGYFGGTWANTAYLGAAEPGGTKWWQGWSYYAVN